MTSNPLTPIADNTARIKQWFIDAYGSTDKSPSEMDILILYKLHELEKKIKVLEWQTQTHWASLPSSFEV